MWWRRSWFSLKGKVGIHDQARAAPLRHPASQHQPAHPCNTAAEGEAGRDAARARAAGSQDRRPGGQPPVGPPEVAAMSRTLSPASGRPDGLARACRVWRASRASVYRHRSSSRPEPPRRPGPIGPMPDAALVDAIRAVLTASPFHDEGHRKVWARLRVAGVRTSKRRVLRLMRENSLLSPHRGPQRPANDHDGRITTDAPGVMWGTDAAVIPTVEDANIALFVVVEHWNAEALGWHVAEKADRFAAAQALDLAVHNACGAVRADAARGLLLRHDHGSAFMSDHFQNQIAFLGMTPSFAFVRQPETNGVAERFIRTLKEQVVWGRIFRNAEEVRAAVRAFVARYNEHWLLEKNAYRSPAQTRRGNCSAPSV